MKKTLLCLSVMFIVSSAYAADKYPLDPAYAANKIAMESAKIFEQNHVTEHAPNASGKEWHLVYSGNAKSSVNIPSGAKFVSVDIGEGLEVYPVVAGSTLTAKKEEVKYQTCIPVGHGEQNCTDHTDTLTLKVSTSKVTLTGSGSSSATKITRVYTQ
ncbi:hypothetical protein [Vibrio algicola]|uniref:hypothetical protein n=1 Tax=Vibrio algicola TaxID=2662262 RepID=UPI0015B6E01C|nr:hypothetical protein [Vibrio algicola]